jgi:DNA-binding response OmpR family regulator
MARILIVEDEPDLRELLHAALSSAGYDVVTAADGRQALNAARAQAPDLVVLDLMLPDMDGTDVCRTLRAEPQTSTAAVFIVSAKNDLLDRIGAFQEGADDYLVKPFSFRELLLRIRAMLRRGHVELPVADAAPRPAR